jgi:hypothetical protein
MRPACLAFLAFFAASSTLWAIDYPELTPKDPVTMALGGSFASVQTAESSFFGNPAYFASPKASFDMSTDAWAYLQPTAAGLGAAAKVFSGSSNPVSGLASLMPSNDGVGGGASLGIGYAGKGIGMGLFAITDDFAAGDSIPGAVLQSDTEVDMIFGLGLPLKLFGDTLLVGGDFRPYYRVRSDEALASAVSNMAESGSGFSGAFLNSVQAYAGFGLSMDVGASLRMGSFDLGLSVRDISPNFPLWKGSFQDLLNYMKNEGSLPITSNTSETASFLPDASIGLAWRPRVLPGKVDPALFLEVQDPVRVAESWQGWSSAFQLLHAGAELKLLSFLSLRGGINKGWLSAGAGVKFLFLDLDASVFTEELGALPGDQPRSGLAVQASLRF